MGCLSEPFTWYMRESSVKVNVMKVSRPLQRSQWFLEAPGPLSEDCWLTGHIQTTSSTDAMDCLSIVTSLWRMGVSNQKFNHWNWSTLSCLWIIWSQLYGLEDQWLHLIPQKGFRRIWGKRGRFHTGWGSVVQFWGIELIQKDSRHSRACVFKRYFHETCLRQLWEHTLWCTKNY